MTPTVEAPTFADPVEPGAAQRRRARARSFPRRRVRADRTADPASGGDLPRHVGRGGPPPPVPDRRRRGRGAVPEAGIYDPRLPRLSRFGQGRRRRRIFLSRPGLPRPGGAGRASRRRPGSRASAARTRRRQTPKCSRWPWRRRRRRAAARSPRGSATRACSTACLIRLKFRTSGAAACAAASPAGAASTPSSSRPSQGALGAAGRAGGAGKRRPRRRQGAGRGSAGDRRHRRGRRAQRRRDRRPVSRAGVAAVGRADRSREARGAGSVPRHFRRSRRGGDRASAPGPIRQARPRRGARRVRERNGFIAARGVEIENIRFSAAFVRDFDYYTGFVFEAHDPAKLRARRPRLPADATTGSRGGSARSADIPAVGAAITLDRLPNGESADGASSRQRRRSAVRPRRPLQGATAGGCRGVLRPRRPRARRRGAAPATIAARSPVCRASRSPMSRRPRSSASLPPARPISASPARTWCARRFPTSRPGSSF